VHNVTTPAVQPGCKHVYHLYELHFKDKNTRDSAQAFLKEKGVYSALHYPVPCHKQDIYKGMDHGDLQVSEELADTLLSLPMHPFLEVEEIRYICDCIKEFFGK